MQSIRVYIISFSLLLMVSAQSVKLSMNAQNIVELLQQSSVNSCNPQQNGIAASDVSRFVEKVNGIRNRVAGGQIPNHLGQIAPAYNMNYISWNDGIARGAQFCAERCPTLLTTKCSTYISGKGYASVIRIRMDNSNAMDIDYVLNNFMNNVDKAKALLSARATQFGCGKSVNIARVGSLRPQEHVVCFFNLPPLPTPYVVGNVRDCDTAPGYYALCVSAFSPR